MRTLSYTLACLAMGAVAGSADARVEADPNKDYAVTPEAGPWMILVTTYVGPEAPQLAHQMVLEIRNRFDLPAFVVNRGAEERRKQQQELEQFRMQFPGYTGPIRHTRIQEQCAVLVGGYKDMDAAHRALKDVKKLPAPSSEKLMAVLAQAGPPQKVGNEEKSLLEGTFVNPFPNSFVVPNPTVPQERKGQNKNDPFLKKLNAHESFSLLRCKKPWTLIVATYQGMHTILPKEAPSNSLFDNLWGSNTGELLEASGQNAHNLADAMRKLGFEAYVLHIRDGSLVTIGGFDRSDDPRMDEVRRALTSYSAQLSQHVQMLPQPTPMEIPRP